MSVFIKLQYLKVALLFTLAFAVFGGATAQTTPDLSKVVLRVGAPNKIGNRPYLDVAGQLKDVPYKIEWSDFGGGTPALLEALRSGHVDIGGNGGITGILFEAGNNPGSGVRVIAAGRSILDTSGAAVLVRADSPYKTLKDLKGAKVSVVRGSGSHYLVGKELKEAGLGSDDYKLLHLANDTALSSLVGGHIDAWVTWDPQATTLQSRGDLRLVSWLGGKEDAYPIQFASEQALKDPAKRAAIADFLQRLSRSVVWVSRNPEPFAKVTSDLIRVPVPDLLQIAKKTRIEYGLTREQQLAVQARFLKEAEFWRAQGVISRTPDIAGLFDVGFNSVMNDATTDAKASKPQ